MSKDPAFLFYPNDYYTGTMTFNRCQKGAYVDLLVCQFNQGHLSLDDVKDVLGEDFPMWDKKIKAKFKQDSDGLFFNERLEMEQNKRKNYTESRRSNRKKTNSEEHMNDHMNNHMLDHMKDHITNDMGNGNGNINEDIKGNKEKGKPKAKKADKVKPVKASSKEKNPVHVAKAGELDYHNFNSKLFHERWNTLLMLPKWKKKIPASFQITLDKLKAYPEKFVEQLLLDAIEGGWQGVVFADTPDKFRKWTLTVSKETIKANESDKSESFNKDFRGQPTNNNSNG